MVLPLGITVSMFANIDAAFSGGPAGAVQWACTASVRRVLVPLPGALPVLYACCRLCCPSRCF